MGSNFRIRLAVTLIFLASAILLFFANNRMESQVAGLVKTVRENSEPDQSLLRIKELWTDISGATSHIRAYIITRDEEHLNRFLAVRETIKPGFDSLEVHAAATGRDLQPYVEIEALLNRKLVVYDSLLEINYDRIISISPVLDDSVLTDTALVDLPEGEGNVLQRMFSAKYSRKAAKARSDSIIAERNNRLDQYRRNVAMLQAEEERLLREQSAIELQLLGSDRELTVQIEQLIRKLESSEHIRQAARAAATVRQADEAASGIRKMIFIGLGLILVLLVLVLRDVEIAGKRRRELQEARNRAEKLARAKEEFLSTMSHEIRTPLTSVIGFSDKLAQTSLDSDQQRYVKAITGSSEHLLSVVNDVLDFTRVETGKLRLDQVPFRPAEIFSEVADALSWKAREKNLELKLFIQPVSSLTLHGDPVRLRQVVFNLVGNAIKFTQKGSVDLTATFVEENEKAVLIFKVSDTGPGIPADRLDAIFGEFEQASASTAGKFGGSGLGLAITKRIVEQQGGSIQVESHEGLGSVFTVRIPFAYGEQHAKESSYTEEIPAQQLAGLNILIAEDDPMIRELQVHSLENMGAKVFQAETGLQALDLLRENDIALILMDIQMPEMTGPEALRVIRDRFTGAKRDVPVIAMTANILQHDLNRWMEEGMNDYVTKPFREADLLEKIAKLLHREVKTAVQAPESVIQTEPVPSAAAPVPEKGYTYSQPRPEKLYDLSELIQSSQGSHEFVRKMINLFLTSAFASVNNLKFHLKQHNWEQLGKTAHRMIGSYRQLGMDYPAGMLKEIEDTSLGSRELGKAAWLVSETEKYSNEVFVLLKKELEKYT
jgi:signal transduction histidine kinase/CheY-like chemotaxis protein